MTSISLSSIVTELSRDGSRQAYLLLSDTEQKAAEMYSLVKTEIVRRGIPHTVIDFTQGLATLLDPSEYQRDSSLLLLENTASVPANEMERLNTYIKQLTDFAAGSMLWYLSIDALGRLSSGYGNRARGAFQTITSLIPDE